MTANLPDNVTAETVYTVRSDSHMDAKVHVALDGSVWITQAEDGHVIVPTSAIPGLIAALSAAAGLPLPEAPEPDPTFIIDGEGDRWERQADGRFVLYVEGHPVAATRSLILRVYGIRSEG